MVSPEYDAVIVLGSGIGEDGSLPLSSQAMVREAVQLLKTGRARRLIVSGKWTHTITYQPPTTEALAMKQYALQQGARDKDILMEDQSEMTLTNLCLVKKRYLEPHGWRCVILVGVYPQAQRAFYIMERVMGPEYSCTLQLADFVYPEGKLQESEAVEARKMSETIRFFSGISPGDHEAVYALAMKNTPNHTGKQH